ncbi:MAG: hypothetical protein ACI8WB_003108 [Phenylobacterium sp.]|jgi:hypothetical protein
MFRIENDKALYLEQTRVTISCCFPQLHQDKFLSVRDENNCELLFIDDVEQLSAADKQLVLVILQTHHQRITVLKVTKVSQALELRVFEFETSAGTTLCYTRLTDWPNRIDKDDYLLIDIHQDEYLIQPHQLDKTSLKRLTPFLE